MTTFQRIHSQRVGNVTSKVDLRPYLAYDPAAGPWENTLLAACSPRDWQLLEAPPGFGITVFMPDAHPQGRVRSRYILLDGPEVDEWSGCPLRLLQKTRIGNLYVNVDYADSSP